MAITYINGVYPDEEYNHRKKLLEMELESPVIPRVSAAEEAGKLIMDLPRLWSIADQEEKRKLLLTMLDAVYIDTKQSKSIVAINLSRLLNLSSR
jgi:site-specific DNA recombinase